MAKKSIFQRFAVRILDFDDTSPPREQLNFISHFKMRFKFDELPKDAREFVKVMAKKHLVDSIMIVDSNGKLLLSTNGASREEALTEAAVFNYILSQIKTSETLIVKARDNYVMMLPHNGKIYRIRAGSNLTTVELKALAKELEDNVKELSG
jgi:hypothetical protein